MPALRWIVLVIFLLSLPGLSNAVTTAKNPPLTKQQGDFVAASKALERGDMATYKRLKKSLRKYALYPYLEYAELDRNLTTTSDRRIEKFLKNYPDLPPAQRLKKKWLKKLAKEKRWSKYYSQYSAEFDSNDTLHCHYLNAALKQKKDVQEDIKKLWMTGSKLPTACSTVFKPLYDNNQITQDLLWRRFVLASNKRNSTISRFLAKKMPAKEGDWYTYWKKMDKQPLQTLTRVSASQDNHKLRDMLVYGIKRYAREDTAAAWTLWQTRIKPDFKFSAEQEADVERNIALRAAWRHEPDAQEWLNSLDEDALNHEARQWRVRAAIRAQDWKDVLQQIAGLPENERDDEQWQYWKARAYHETGRVVSAKLILEELAAKTDYYGFLAADKLGMEYKFNHDPVTDETDEPGVKALAEKPAFERALELHKIGWETDANREWNHAISNLSKDEKRLAASLAHEWGWHFTAILTVAKAGHFDDLQLRFPIEHEGIVLREARRHEIQPSWVYGVIRRESAWREEVRSPAGALGLMQLMPATAKQVSRKLGQRSRLSSKQIMEVPRNISLGTAYLRQVMDKYNDHEILATASYNAGPHRVKRWLPEEDAMPADIWVDTIPFDETRKYVKAVMAYSTIADWKLNGDVRSLTQRMEQIQPLEVIEARTAANKASSSNKLALQLR